VTDLTTHTPGAKGSRLTGAALTRETVASSRDVLRASGLLPAKGLQQFYSPPEAAELIGRVMHAGHCNAVDLTAGDGALLAGWPREQRYGVEIDADQVAAGDYHAIQGDLQHIYPLLRLTRLGFRAVVLNPPFGLTWTDSHGKSINSTLLTLRYGLGVLDERGQGVLIAGRDRFAREIADQPEARGVYAVIECHDLFESVELPCVLAFFRAPHKRSNDTGPAWRTATRVELPELVQWVNDAHGERCDYAPAPYVSPTGLRTADETRTWKTIDNEHARRRGLADARQATHDLTLRSGRLRVSLTAFASLALSRAKALDTIQRLHRQSDSYFAYNTREWLRVKQLAADGVLTVCPDLEARVERVIAGARRALVPNYPIKPQQRLGYLDDLDSILCVTGDTERGYLAGERYPLSVESKVKEEHGVKIVYDRKGEAQQRRWRHERKLLQITIGPHSFDEEPEEIAFILEHFDVPDPGDLASLYPDDVEAMRDVLRGIQRDYGLAGHHGPRSEGRIRWAYKDFQIEDLARTLVKRNQLLSWEQGLGKTLGMMTLAIALERLGVQPAALFVVPQDLIPQWRDEARNFFGRSFTLIQSPAHARQVAKHVAAGGSGWYIVHMEGLSLTGRRDESLNLPLGASSRRDERPMLVVHPSQYLRLSAEDRARAIKNSDVPALDGGGDVLSTEEVCPSCLTTAGATADSDDGPAQWDGRRCLQCGYVHKRRRVHTAGHWLSTAFRRGTIFVDEITNAAGDSMRADAVCGLHSDNRFGGTGTPIKNYVNDSFKILWWCLRTGDRFPYDYSGGRGKFERDFCVIEYLFGAKPGDSRRKVLPRVTNLSMLWRLLCGGIIRRRKEDTGEPLVPLTLHPIWVPAGVAQAEMNKQWAKNFTTFFTLRHPNHPLVEAGVVEKFEAALGLLWKMEYASTLPAADPDLDALRELVALDPEATERLRSVSNWTPANLKALERALKHARQGEKVVLFSDLIETGRWMSEQLRSRGVRAEHIVEARGGKAATMSPAKRARAMREFRFGATQVLCVGIKAVKQGHNLDTASVAIFAGQEWSHEAKAQAMARVHRLSSKKPVNVYLPMPSGAYMAAKKHELLNAKGASSDLALDGQLIEQNEREITWQEVIEQMKRQGMAATGDEILEADVKATWDRAEGPFAPLQPAAAAPIALPRPAIARPRLAVGTAPAHVDVDLVAEEPVEVIEHDGQFALAI
jgi:hypothetical protein